MAEVIRALPNAFLIVTSTSGRTPAACEIPRGPTETGRGRGNSAPEKWSL